MNKNNQQLLEGSQAIANTIRNIAPAVVAAYPITPQTHIVENLANKKTSNYEYLRAESEFAAASAILGAAAAGVRTYSATSSQGLLLMAEVVWNIAGMRLPAVMTVANRALSGPINIWNDQQDYMAISACGWLGFFAENHQEAVFTHILAYKIAEKTGIPAFVNVDGFIMTHSFEPVYIPTAKEIRTFLPAYRAKERLDVNHPMTMGAFCGPDHYLEFRKQLHTDLLLSLKTINLEYAKLKQTKFYKKAQANRIKSTIDNGLIEYCGPKKPQSIVVAMGSIIGTIKTAVENHKKVGVLKLKCYRPFPIEEITKIIKTTKVVKVIDKAIDLGFRGPLARDISAILPKNARMEEYIVGLGGRDFNLAEAKQIICK